MRVGIRDEFEYVAEIKFISLDLHKTKPYTSLCFKTSKE